MEPKSEANKTRRRLSVMPKTQISGEPEPLDRRFVFPEGFAVVEQTGDDSDPASTPTFWGGLQAEGPVHVRQGSHDYWLWKVWGKPDEHPDSRRVWAGWKVRGALGETVHVLPETVEPQALLDAHLANPEILKQKASLKGRLASLQFDPIETVSTKDVALLVAHGVFTNGTVVEVLHPKGVPLLASLSRRDAYLVTDDSKVVDIAAHAWPIDLGVTPDFRTQLMAPVRYGEHLGVVAGHMGEFVVFKSKQNEVVPYHDLDPIMVEQSLRQIL
jgi:hypothetical protein